MSAQGIRAGQAYVEMYADQSKLERGLKGAAALLKDFGGKVRGIFATAFGPVGTVVNSLVSTVEGPLGDAFGFIGEQSKGIFNSAIMQNFGDNLANVGGELKAVWELVYQQLGRVVNGILQNLQPAFGKGVQLLKGMLSATRDWLMKNEQVIATFIKIATSGEVLWTGLKLAWLKGTAALTGMWNGFLGDMVKKAVDAANKISKLMGGSGGFTDGGFGAGLAAGDLEMSKKIAKARKAFDDAVERAKNRNIDLNVPFSPTEVQSAMNQAGPRTAVTGTFSAGAVGGLGGSNYGLQIADNTRRMTEYQRKLLEKAEAKKLDRGGIPNQ